MHRLLRDQLLGKALDYRKLPAEWQHFVREIDASYQAFERERKQLERSLEASERDLKSASDESRAAEEVLRRTLQATEDGVLAIDAENRVVFVNDRYFEILDMPREVFERSSRVERLHLVAERLLEPAPFLERMSAIQRSGELIETFDILPLKSGRVVARSLRGFRGPDGRSGRVWTYRDVTQSYMLEEQLRHQAFHDPLTGLANRARFADRLQLGLEHARRLKTPVFVLFMDVDDFKAVNDSLGHTLGDSTLQAIAGRLRESLPEGDMSARLGGDEFAILLEGMPNLGATQAFAESLLDAIRAPLILDGHEIALDASIGIVECEAQETPEEILRNADIAMYAAKRQGKGRAQTYMSGMHSTVRERQQLITELRHALERQELRVLYQPAVVLADQSVAGAEALVRWAHPERGVLLPDEFVPLAEESGLIDSIGEFVLLDACRLLAEWQARPETRHLTVNVNVSARQVRDSRFVDKVRMAIRQTGVHPGGLTLEITESAMIEDPDRCFETLTLLRRTGLTLALDDFGTGFSSLSHLQRFPIDVLKIDRSFIDGLHRSEHGNLLISATIGFGKQLKLRIFAEGIETKAQLDHLRGLECEYGQGFLFSHALSRDELGAYVRERLGHRAAA